MAGLLYVKLDASYPDDEKIILAGEKAELLYVRGLCLAKRILSDGFIADAHLPRFGLQGVEARARRLCQVGLWRRDDDAGGYWISSWLKHNPSAGQVAEIREKRRHAGKQSAQQRAQQSVEQHAEQVDEHPSKTEEEEEEEGSRGAVSELRPDVTQAYSDTVHVLTRRLALAVKANGHKVPDETAKTRGKWLDAIRLLLDRDGADPGEVERVIDWATGDEFWRANIQSAPKFREKYSQLRLQMQRGSGRESYEALDRYEKGAWIR